MPGGEGTRCRSTAFSIRQRGFALIPGTRIFLLSQFVDRTGSGVWLTSCILYFALVDHLRLQQIGLMLAVAGLAAVLGSPLAGFLADIRFLPLRSLLVCCHLLRLVALSLVLAGQDLVVLIPAVAVTYLGDGAAKTLEMLIIANATDERASIYQAWSRSAVNAGYALGAGISAIGSAVGTGHAYRTLIGVNALSFLIAAGLVLHTPDRFGDGRVDSPSAPAASSAASAAPSPWRDRDYLLFTLMDIAMNMDDSVLKVGLPLWLLGHTAAPHALVPAFLMINTVLIVISQVGISAKMAGAHRSARAVPIYGATMFLCCAIIAACDRTLAWMASAGLLIAATLVTVAELIRSASSWNLAVALAPPEARASYIGVASMAPSIQKSIGPSFMTGVVLAFGAAGWVALGLALACLSVAQRQICLHRLNRRSF
ncbi:MFS transporter [Actinomadura montaniterrae]|uniref:MFS transporter n=1 Tax=Actinomadura montaniterrae TaxID=1803903 RepID=A0A6L3VQD6_9ACTN|nr:MFS transporter [Actinomadura montaniterrae]KAB2378973.1 MFS transporter [Actinomadura montaniterrae]